MLNPAHNLYFHVPFCAHKCNYCAFYSVELPPSLRGENKLPDIWSSYKNEILSELDYWSSRVGRVDVPTIFFGGGTPSLMPVEIFAEIMASTREKFNVLPNAEITIEANPGTIDSAQLREFIAAGVNRISIGVQSLNDEELKFLGRIHDSETAREFIKTAQNSDIRVSADFIYGLPNQTARDVRAMCEQINELGLTHCSMYELSIEKGTPFAGQNLRMPNNETMAAMYEEIGKTLNLPRYEVSNYALPGQECKHNSNIWDGEPYLGFGPSAAGRPFINGEWYETKVEPRFPFCVGKSASQVFPSCGGVAAGRGGSVNSRRLQEPPRGSQNSEAAPLHRRGTETPPQVRINKLSMHERSLEILMTGLRTARGVKIIPEIRDIINLDFVHNNKVFEIVKTADGQRLRLNNFLTLDSLLVNLLK